MNTFLAGGCILCKHAGWCCCTGYNARIFQYRPSFSCSLRCCNNDNCNSNGLMLGTRDRGRVVDYKEKLFECVAFMGTVKVRSQACDWSTELNIRF